MLDFGAHLAEPVIAGTLPDRQPASGGGLLLHRPEHAGRFGCALPGAAGVALVTIHRAVVMADQAVHHLRLVYAAAGHKRRNIDLHLVVAKHVRARSKHQRRASNCAPIMETADAFRKGRITKLLSLRVYIARFTGARLRSARA